MYIYLLDLHKWSIINNRYNNAENRDYSKHFDIHQAISYILSFHMNNKQCGNIMFPNLLNDSQ